MHRRRLALPYVGAALLAFVGAVVLVKTWGLSNDFRVDAGEALSVGEPPAHPLGASNEALAAARCSELAPPVPLADALPGAVDFGDGIIDSRGLVAVGAVRPQPGSRAATLVTFSLGESADRKVRLSDLGPVGGDDPTPRPYVLGASLHAARTQSSAERRVLELTTVGTIDAAGMLRVNAAPVKDDTLDQGKDESLAYDLDAVGDRGFVAWDDDEKGRGIIRVRSLSSPPGSAESAVIVSPSSSDAEAPRLVTDGADGAWIAWIARKAEAADAGPLAAADLVGHGIETPAEARESRWLEVVRVDGALHPRAPALRLEPGRISDFDLHRVGKGAGAGLEIVLRDETGSSETRGARLVVASVRPDGVAAETAVLLRDGVGAADPMIVDDGALGLLAYADTTERLRLLPAPSGPLTSPKDADAGLPSVEPGFEGGRVLASAPLAMIPSAIQLARRIRPGIGSDGGRVASLVVALGFRQERAEARILLCER